MDTNEREREKGQEKGNEKDRQQESPKSIDAKERGREKGREEYDEKDEWKETTKSIGGNEGEKAKEEGRCDEKDQERESPKSSVRLTTRDKELLAHVATARYLTLSQLKRVVFVKSLVAKQGVRASGKEGPSDVVCRRRLMKLCAGRAPYLRRLQYRDHEGVAVAVYASELLGHSIARQVLSRAPPALGQDVKAQFLEHTLRLNDLYVALAEGCARQRVPPSRYPFWWNSTEIAGLPWQERSDRTGRMEERRLAPDAVLQLAAERVRIFLECEMGGHPLIRRDENALGSALSKLNRYAAFVVEGGPQTFYAQKYPDGWRAELVFLVHSEERAANLTGVIAGWREQNKAVPLVATALSFAQAAGHLCARFRLPAPQEDPASAARAELRLTCSFVSQVAATYKAVRQYLRANPAVRTQGCPYPEYTPEFERMVALVERYRTQLGNKQ